MGPVIITAFGGVFALGALAGLLVGFLLSGHRYEASDLFYESENTMNADPLGRWEAPTPRFRVGKFAPALALGLFTWAIIALVLVVVL